MSKFSIFKPKSTVFGSKLPPEVVYKRLVDITDKPREFRASTGGKIYEGISNGRDFEIQPIAFGNNQFGVIAMGKIRRWGSGTRVIIDFIPCANVKIAAFLLSLFFVPVLIWTTIEMIQKAYFEPRMFIVYGFIFFVFALIFGSVHSGTYDLKADLCRRLALFEIKPPQMPGKA